MTSELLADKITNKEQYILRADKLLFSSSFSAEEKQFLTDTKDFVSLEDGSEKYGPYLDIKLLELMVEHCEHIDDIAALSEFISICYTDDDQTDDQLNQIESLLDNFHANVGPMSSGVDESTESADDTLGKTLDNLTLKD